MVKTKTISLFAALIICAFIGYCPQNNTHVPIPQPSDNPGDIPPKIGPKPLPPV